jgi:hypothetical protein
VTRADVSIRAAERNQLFVMLSESPQQETARFHGFFDGTAP